jgi:hypothetical protein
MGRKPRKQKKALKKLNDRKDYYRKANLNELEKELADFEKQILDGCATNSNTLIDLVHDTQDELEFLEGFREFNVIDAGKYTDLQNRHLKSVRKRLYNLPRPDFQKSDDDEAYKMMKNLQLLSEKFNDKLEIEGYVEDCFLRGENLSTKVAFQLAYRLSVFVELNCDKISEEMESSVRKAVFQLIEKNCYPNPAYYWYLPQYKVTTEGERKEIYYNILDIMTFWQGLSGGGPSDFEKLYRDALLCATQATFCNELSDLIQAIETYQETPGKSRSKRLDEKINELKSVTTWEALNPLVKNASDISRTILTIPFFAKSKSLAELQEKLEDAEHRNYIINLKTSLITANKTKPVYIRSLGLVYDVKDHLTELLSEDDDSTDSSDYSEDESESIEPSAPPDELPSPPPYSEAGTDFFSPPRTPPPSYEESLKMDKKKEGRNESGHDGSSTKGRG